MANKKTKRKPIKQKRKHLSHRKHTAHLQHHSYTSYPLVMLLLILVGIFMFYATKPISAANVTVNASNPNGPAPTVAAEILSPIEGQTFTSVPIPVSGSCEPGYIVRLYRNSLFAGSMYCSVTGQFKIMSDLFVGKNTLIASTFNAADVAGPDSTPVTVSYNPPPPSSVNTPTPTPITAEDPFYVTPRYFYIATKTGKQIEWRFKPVGGTEPYTINVLWGDGKSSRSDNIDDSWITLTHTYDTPPDFREYYPVNVELRDSDGRIAYLQVFSIVNERTLLPAASTSGSNSDLLPFMWPAYILTLLIGVAFWLGEKRGEFMARRLRTR